MNNFSNSSRDSKNRPPSTPRWVKVSGIIVITLILLFVILKLTGIGGNHGPGRHFPGGESSSVQFDQEAPGDLSPSSDHMTSGDDD